MKSHWQVVSTYDDDGHEMRVVELEFKSTWEIAQKIARIIQEERADQTQGPVVTIEQIHV